MMITIFLDTFLLVLLRQIHNDTHTYTETYTHIYIYARTSRAYIHTYKMRDVNICKYISGDHSFAVREHDDLAECELHRRVAVYWRSFVSRKKSRLLKELTENAGSVSNSRWNSHFSFVWIVKKSEEIRIARRETREIPRWSRQTERSSSVLSITLLPFRFVSVYTYHLLDLSNIPKRLFPSFFVNL